MDPWISDVPGRRKSVMGCKFLSLVSEVKAVHVESDMLCMSTQLCLSMKSCKCGNRCTGASPGNAEKETHLVVDLSK